MTCLRQCITSALPGAIATWTSSVLLPVGLVPVCPVPLVAWSMLTSGADCVTMTSVSRGHVITTLSAGRVVTGFPSFKVDVPETVLVTLVFFLFEPRDGTIMVPVVVTSTLVVVLPVVIVLAGLLAHMLGSLGRWL